MSKRALALAAAGAAIAVVAAVVLIGRGDSPAGEIVHGRPGFPWRAAAEGQSALDDAERRAEQSLGDAQTLNVVWTGRLPGHRHGAVVSEAAARR